MCSDLFTRPGTAGFRSPLPFECVKFLLGNGIAENDVVVGPLCLEVMILMKVTVNVTFLTCVLLVQLIEQRAKNSGYYRFI